MAGPPRDSAPRARGRRRVGGIALWVLLAGGLLLVGAYAALCLRAGDKVPAGASVAGVPIGGLHADAAERRLRTTLGARADRPIVLTGAGRTATYVPADAGLRLDAARSVREAGGGSSYWPARIWRYYTGHGADRDAAAKVDAKKLDLATAGVVKVVAKQVVQGRITFDRGRAVTRSAQDGRHVESADAQRALRHGFLRTSPATVRWTTVEPRVGDAAVRRAMTRFARPATSAPVTLYLNDHRIEAPPRLFTQAIKMVRDDTELVARLDVGDLLAALEPVMADVAGTPQPAQVAIVDGKPRVVPSKIGITFDRTVLQQRFLDAAVQPSGKRVLRIKGVTAPPAFTTADARRMRITQRVADYSTPFGYAEYRNVNIARAADLIDGTIVQPGQTFSLEDTVGRPTRDNGFVPGFEISGGVFRPDAGAGLSQVASTLFNAMFVAGLTDAGHEVTSVYSGRYPLGREASFEYGKEDLRFTNDTRFGVLVKAEVSPSSTSGDGRLSVSLWSTRAWDVEVLTSKRYAEKAPRVVHRTGAGCDARTGFPGFSVDVTRVFRRPGQKAVDHRQRTTTVYRPTDAVICDP